MSLKFRPRLASAEKLSRPLNSVRTWVRPRISTPAGSAEKCELSSLDCRRDTVMPGTRCSASATDLSGKAPMSVAVIESTTVSAFFLMCCALSSDLRTPTTTTSSTVSAASLSASATPARPAHGGAHRRQRDQRNAASQKRLACERRPN
jgi:hypothetical protein